MKLKGCHRPSNQERRNTEQCPIDINPSTSACETHALAAKKYNHGAEESANGIKSFV
jgi:hypothetical protein